MSHYSSVYVRGQKLCPDIKNDSSNRSSGNNSSSNSVKLSSVKLTIKMLWQVRKTHTFPSDCLMSWSLVEGAVYIQVSRPISNNLIKEILHQLAQSLA